MGLTNILIITNESDNIKGLTAKLDGSGIHYSIASNIEQYNKHTESRSSDLVLADIDTPGDIQLAIDMQSRTNATKNSLLMVIIPVTMLAEVANNVDIIDFIIKPYDINELLIRIQRLVKTIKQVASKNKIGRGDLAIDMDSCEVSLGDKFVELTFKEYELLCFLAANKGQVFTRETLLNKVWKYDYLGGERTVDVHIRRLRSKIEDADHTFIDTVRNIGYRFRKDI